MPSPRPPRLAVERLEPRDVPTAFGVPWADPGHLTLSFVPDGTATPRGPSALGATLGAAGPAAVWQREVLRAFQTWAAVANVNVGLVADGGQALGTPGAVQGDARFGDARIAAAPLSGGALASALPFSWTGTTFSGDVLFDAGTRFGTGAGDDAIDVYSVALHEAGHVLGLAHPDEDHDHDHDSVMHAAYEYAAGLDADDVAAVQALYGARSPDAADAAGGNDTAARATPMRASGLAGRVVADGDLTTAADVDFYTFRTLPTLGLTNVTVRLQAAGLSLLTARVTVSDAAGRVVAATATTDPLNNDLTLRFRNAPLGGTYTVKVEGATEDVFGIGAYRLTTDTVNLDAVPLPVLSALLTPVLDRGLNDTLASATDLTTLAPPADARFDATYRGAVEWRTDVDTYKLRAPAGTGPLALNVLVWGTGAAPLDPAVRVSDAAGNPVAHRVIANDAGVVSVEVRGATPGATYYVSVSARTPNGANTTGAYFLGADFNQFAAVERTEVAAGKLDAGTPAAGTLTIEKGGVTQFALSAAALGGAGGTVTMTVFDAAGRVVLTLEAVAGQPLRTAVVYLEPGTYTVRYATRGANGLPPGALGFGLSLLRLSDDAGPYGTTTTKRPPDETTTTAAPPPAETTTTSEPEPYMYSSGETYEYGGPSKTYSYGTPYYF